MVEDKAKARKIHTNVRYNCKKYIIGGTPYEEKSVYLYGKNNN